MLQSVIKSLIGLVGTPTVEKEIITFGIAELTANTKITPTELRTTLTEIQTAVNDAIAALPPAE